MFSELNEFVFALRPYNEVEGLGDLYASGNTGLTGPRLNIKTVLSTYGDFHVKDKTAVRTSYL